MIIIVYISKILDSAVLVIIFILELILIYCQIKTEEKDLIEYFGDDYIEYQYDT